MPLTTLDRPPLEPVYSWTKGFVKALKPAVTLAVVSGLLVFAGTLDVDTLMKAGVPQFIAVVAVDMLRNYVKQHRG